MLTSRSTPETGVRQNSAQASFHCNIESPLLCRKSAAIYLGVAAQTLAQWAATGKYKLPYIRIGRKAMYRKSDLDAFIDANVHFIGTHTNGGQNQ